MPEYYDQAKPKLPPNPTGVPEYTDVAKPIPPPTEYTDVARPLPPPPPAAAVAAPAPAPAPAAPAAAPQQTVEQKIAAIAASRDAIANSGVNLDKHNSGDVINGKRFVHNGYGWVMEDAGAPAAAAAPGVPGAPAAADPNALYKEALMKQLTEAGTPASLNDPALKAQSEAYAVGQTRASEQARAAMAERMAQDGSAGTNSGAFNNGLSSMFQQQGENQAGFNAGLVGDAAKQKLQQMQSALAMMGNDMNSEAGRTLQKQIADTEAEIKRMGIQSQADLGGRDIALRDKLGTAGLNAQIAQMLMQNQQFGQGLGSENARFSAGLNQEALLKLFGGI